MKKNTSFSTFAKGAQAMLDSLYMIPASTLYVVGAYKILDDILQSLDDFSCYDDYDYEYAMGIKVLVDSLQDVIFSAEEGLLEEVPEAELDEYDDPLM